MEKYKRFAILLAAAAVTLSLTVDPAFASDGERTDTEIPIAGEELFGEHSGETTEPPPASKPQTPPEEETPSTPDSSGESAPEETPGDMHGDSSQQIPSDAVKEKEIVWARVTNMITDPTLSDSLFAGRSPGSIVFEAVIQEGSLTGSTVSVLRDLQENEAVFSVPVRSGDAVFIHLERDENGTARATFSSFKRFPALLWAAAAAIVLLLVCIPRKSGLKLAATILISSAIIGFIFVSFPSVLTAVVCCVLIVVLSTLIFYGVKYKTLAACCGALFSLGAGALFSMAGSRIFYLSGLPLSKLPDTPFADGLAPNLSMVFNAGVVLSTLGMAVMVSNVTAAGAEPRDPADTSAPAAFARGMRRGVSSLIPLLTAFCFTLFGGILTTAILLWQAGTPVPLLLSDELIAAELSRLLTGVITVGLCVPITSFISFLLIKVRADKNGMLREFHVWEALTRHEHAFFGKAAQKLDEAIPLPVTENHTEAPDSSSLNVSQTQAGTTKNIRGADKAKES